MNRDENKPNTAGITIGLPNSSNKGFDIKAGVIDNANTYNPNNNLKLYDSKDKYNRIPSASVIMCNIDCQELLKNATTLNIQDNTKSNTNIESQRDTESTNQPFTYQDSNITAKEIINNDNTTSLIIETKTSLLEYQGNTTDTLMAGISAMFASMATLAEKYGVNKSLKEVEKGILGTKGRILSSVLFQTQGASVSLAYNYGNNGNDLLKAGVSVGIELGVGALATTLIPASAPVLVFVGVSALAAVGIGYLLNTQAGKWAVNAITENLVKPLIESIESLINSIKSKLQSFFSLFDTNPSNYELVSNPSLESSDYKSLIELLLDSNSTAKDIDSLLHSFPNYLKKESKQEVYSPTSPQGISFPYSSIIYLTTIKALKDTLKEYLPKAKKIILYTPNPFVSLYTSSPFYIFNSNLSFFNPHLQYLLTSKDTQQWLYDTLFSLARDNGIGF